MRRVIIMNICKKVKNNIEYAKWRRIREKSLAEAGKRLFDEDDTEFKYWAARYQLALKKCMEIDIN